MSESQIFAPEGFGRYIRCLREEMGLSLPEVAEALGVPSLRLRQWELGMLVPDKKHAKNLAALLGVSPSEMLLRWEIASLVWEGEVPWELEETAASFQCPCRPFCQRKCPGIAGWGLWAMTEGCGMCPAREGFAPPQARFPALCHAVESPSMVAP